MGAPPELDIWLGTSTSEELFFSYFEELVGDGPISKFAAGQGIEFYDHDFFMAEYLSDGMTLEGVISSFVQSDDTSTRLFSEIEAWEGRVNVVALQLAELGPVGSQRDATDIGIRLNYVGRFRYAPT